MQTGGTIKFSRYEDIEKQLKLQISGLLYIYLDSLVNRKIDSKVSESVDNLKNLTERMEKMIQKVGEKVFENDRESLNAIKKEQNKSLINFCTHKMGEKIITCSGDEEKAPWNQLSEFLLRNYLLEQNLWEYREMHFNNEMSFKLNMLREQIHSDVENLLKKHNIELFSIEFDELEEMAEGIVEISKENEDNLQYTINMFALELRKNWLPF